MILLGLSLGLGAGLAPGPLLALVIRSTVQGGFGAGVRVAFSPLLTDLPIIVVAVAVAASVPDRVLGVLGIVGGTFVMWLGVETLRHHSAPSGSAGPSASPQRELLMGALTNVLSPHPWVFWITIGAPILGANDVAEGAAFLAAFYTTLIGTKVAIAGAFQAGRGRLLLGRRYAMVLRASGVLLIATGALLSIEGIQTAT